MGTKEIIADVGRAAEALSADDEAANPVDQIESLCMRCRENGTTRLLLTKIPHFREVVLMAFECPHCGEKNNEVQFAGQLQPHGCFYTLNVPEGASEVLNRQVVKSDSASIKVPELDFEVPPEAQRGTLSTVEGVLLRAADELEALQEERRKVDPNTAEALDRFLVNLKLCATAKKPFIFIVSDPAGNSFIESPHAPSPDPLLSIKFYDRTPEQQAALGYLVDSDSNEQAAAEQSTEQTSSTYQEGTKYVPAGTRREPHGSVGALAAHRAIAQGNSDEVAAALFKYAAPEEVMMFPATCGACAAKCETRMFVTNIPYFKEVIIMASTCDTCG
uniref:TSA: Wollemia nobilis Ref_Wollemi_Transcript_28289_1262 transcribed RNA sequence n=1 Tax=Wollemia nobilis TaxID=56998 RepID=A0A0C9S3X2_9CONI